MAKDKLLITIEPLKVPEGKFRKWWFWNVYWKVCRMWKPQLMGFIYKNLADFFYWISPKSVKDELDREFSNIEVIIKHKDNESIQDPS